MKPDAQIAIIAGSRGMGRFVELLAGVVDAVKAKGGRPFLIPAMGSHGGATEEGQTEILRRLGVTEETIGAPIATPTSADIGPTLHARFVSTQLMNESSKYTKQSLPPAQRHSLRSIRA
ncbi:MAG TPA: hypothetical protein VJW17_14820 [Pyrinomonadaceae bacterium]|nr:hypothetical protein [Pyrinomonadaceae bacterium]